MSATSIAPNASDSSTRASVFYTLISGERDSILRAQTNLDNIALRYKPDHVTALQNEFCAANKIDLGGHKSLSAYLSSILGSDKSRPDKAGREAAVTHAAGFTDFLKRAESDAIKCAHFKEGGEPAKIAEGAKAIYAAHGNPQAPVVPILPPIVVEPIAPVTAAAPPAPLPAGEGWTPLEKIDPANPPVVKASVGKVESGGPLHRSMGIAFVDNSFGGESDALKRYCAAHVNSCTELDRIRAALAKTPKGDALASMESRLTELLAEQKKNLDDAVSLRGTIIGTSDLQRQQKLLAEVARTQSPEAVQAFTQALRDHTTHVAENKAGVIEAAKKIVEERKSLPPELPPARPIPGNAARWWLKTSKPFVNFYNNEKRNLNNVWREVCEDGGFMPYIRLIGAFQSISLLINGARRAIVGPPKVLPLEALSPQLQAAVAARSGGKGEASANQAGTVQAGNAAATAITPQDLEAMERKARRPDITRQIAFRAGGVALCALGVLGIRLSLFTPNKGRGNSAGPSL